MYWWEREFKEWQNHADKEDTTDFQRKKLYRSEWAVVAELKDRTPIFESLRDVEKFVKRVTSYAWFIRRFGTCTIEVRPRRDGTWASGWCSGLSSKHIRTGYIKIPKSMWRMDTILHEITHAVLPSRVGAAHGRLFARAVLEMYRLALPKDLGKEYHDKMKAQFKKNNVKFNPRRQLSDETRQKLRDNFINNALAVKEAAKKG